MNRFEDCRSAHEVLDQIIDEWCERERQQRTAKGLPTPKKSDLKIEIGRAIGLGNGDDESSAGKGIYRYCSGETPLGVEKALQVCRYINNYDLIRWLGFQAGLIMTPRAIVDSACELPEDALYEEIALCLNEASHYVEMLSFCYRSPASFGSLRIIDETCMQAVTQMEKTRLMLKKLIEGAIKSGTQGALFGFGHNEKKKNPPQKSRAIKP
jgi:hypothetical protein